MFFIGGITQGTKELVYNAAAMICGRCGRYGRYQVFMTYMCLSFFFIPIFKWGRKYGSGSLRERMFRSVRKI